MDSRGYSSRIIKANRDAPSTIGVMLGRYCISKEIPVADVATFFGVTRMTIYKWFKGLETPRQKQEERIREVLEQSGFKT